MSNGYGWSDHTTHQTTSFTAEGPGARAALKDWLKAQERGDLAAAQVRIRELESEIAALRAGQSVLVARDAEVARLRAALAFYADPQNYVLVGEPDATSELSTWAPHVLGDDGERARVALRPNPEGE